MNLTLLPAYLKDVTFRMEKVRDAEVRGVVCSLFVQPMTYEVAKLMGIDAELYSSPNKPVGPLRSVVLDLGEGKRTHLLRLNSTVDGSTDPAFGTEDAFFGATVKVRRDKEGPVFAGTFEMNFTYPPAKDLLMLVNGINQQYWIDVQPTNPGLFEAADKEAARDEKKRKREAKGRDTTNGADDSQPVA